MNVLEYLKTDEIFTDNVISLFDFFTKTETEREMLNHEFGKIFGHCSMSDELPIEVHNSVLFTLTKYADKYNKIHTALTQQLDPTLIEKTVGKSKDDTTATNKSESKNDTSNSERTYDDLEMTEISKDHGESGASSTTIGQNRNENETTRTRALTYEDSHKLIELHMTSLYDIILKDVGNDLVIPVYIFD